MIRKVVLEAGRKASTAHAQEKERDMAWMRPADIKDKNKNGNTQWRVKEKKNRKTTSGVRNSLPENSRRFNGSNGREGVVGRARGSLFRQGDGPKHWRRRNTAWNHQRPCFEANAGVRLLGWHTARLKETADLQQTSNRLKNKNKKSYQILTAIWTRTGGWAGARRVSLPRYLSPEFGSPGSHLTSRSSLLLPHPSNRLHGVRQSRGEKAAGALCVLHPTNLLSFSTHRHLLSALLFL